MKMQNVKTIVIAGGNSGIGLQAANQILSEGHQVIILGRDKKKGEKALKSFGNNVERATFLQVDLSTHAGVRSAAKQIAEISDQIDGLLHTTGVFEMNDVRTKDGLTLFFAVSYLSRYHLTQLLLPLLIRADHPKVVVMTAKLNPFPKVDPSLFPDFNGFTFKRMGSQIVAANLYYIDYLREQHPKIFTGAVNAGFARTDIFRNVPWSMKMMVAITAPFIANSIETSAHNAVEAVLRGDGAQAVYWDKPGKFNDKIILNLDHHIKRGIIDASKKTTGV